MALISRLFQSRKNQRQPGPCKWPKSIAATDWNAPDFKKSQIRLVVFKDHDIRGRNILFDSKAIKKVEDIESENKKGKNKKSDNCHIRGYGQKQTPSRPNVERPATESPKISGKYQYSTKGVSDTKMLGEMIFGSASLSYRGSSLKVHQFRCPPQLMFTHVFEANSKNREASWEMENYDSYSLHSSLGDLTPGKHIYCRERTNSGTMSSYNLANSVPVEIPSSSSQTLNHQDDSDLSTSFCSSDSFTNPFPSPSSSSSTCINSNSYNSLHRRWMRSHQTCLEYGVRRRTTEREDGFLSQHHLNIQEHAPGIGCKRQSKIGMGIVISMFGEQEEERNGHFQNFFFSHITLFEAHVQKLRINIEKAFINKQDFVTIIMESLDCFRNEIYDLYTAPRLTEPVWLNMMSYSLHRQTVCHQFMKEFISSIEKYETKSTNFFISTLVTAVLTYHLAWIPTVTPAGAIPSRTYLDKHSAKWLDTLTKSHPYNPLWAQLSDLYGAIGFPPKICRTMVVGKKQELICKLLYILSYFIRCSEVYENIESLEEIRDDELELLDRSMDRGVFGDMVPIKEDRTPEVSPKHSVVFIDEQEQQNLVTDFISKCDTRDKCDSDGAMPVLSVSDTAMPCDSESTNYCERNDTEPVCSKSNPTASAFSELGRERTDDSNSTYQAMQNVTISNCDINSPSPRNYDSDDTLCGTCKSDIAVDLETSDIDIGRCKLSPLSMLPHQVEDTRHVRRDNPGFSKADNVTPLETVTSKDIVANSDSPTRRYMRLPSKDEVVTNDLNDLFDGQTEVGMICDRDEKFHGISSEDGDDIPRNDNPLPEAFQSMTDSQYSSGTYNSLSSCRTVPYTSFADSDQADSLFDSYQHREGEDSLDREEMPEKPVSKFQKENIETMKKCPVKDKPTLNIAEILKQRAAEAAVVADTPLSPTATRAPMSPVSFGSSSSPTPSRTASCFSPTQSEKSDDVERGSETCGSPPKLARSRSRNNSGDKPPITRQTSRTNTPGRTRSVTPTELGRRRHASSVSAADSEAFDPFLNLMEMPMPRSEDDVLESNVKAFERNFGRSLLAGYSKCYLSDFVLHGTSDMDYTPKLIADLELAAQTTVLDEPVNEAVCIVADADKWEVKLISSSVGPSTDKAPGMTINGPSQLVANLIESVHDMWKLKMSPDFCLMHLEDRLQEIYFKSRMLSEYMRHRKVGDVKELATVIGCDTSDLSLLFAVAGTHSPSLSFSFL